jgi:hypothetical protein
MSLATNLTLAGRKWHESIMEDTCTITREGNRVLNETTGQYTVETTTIYTGPCRLVVPPRHPKDVAAVGQVEVVEMARLDLPVSTTAGVMDGDVATFTASLDPNLVGRKFLLRGYGAQSQATARRFFVEAYI